MICKIHVKLSYPFADFRMSFSGGGFHNSNYAATIDTGIPQQDSAYQRHFRNVSNQIHPNPSKSLNWFVNLCLVFYLRLSLGAYKCYCKRKPHPKSTD